MTSKDCYTKRGNRSSSASMSIIQNFLVTVKSGLTNAIFGPGFANRIASIDSFEPIVATLSFGLWINLYRIVDAFGLWRQYAINPSTDKATGAKFFLWHVKQRDKKAAQLHVPTIEANTTKAGAVYLGIIFVFDYMFPRRTTQTCVHP